MIVAIVIAVVLVFLMRQLYVWTKVSFYQVIKSIGLDKYWPVLCAFVVAFYLFVVQPNMSPVTFLSDTLWGLAAVPCAVALWVFVAKKFLKYTSTKKYWDQYHKDAQEMKDHIRNNRPSQYVSNLNEESTDNSDQQ